MGKKRPLRTIAGIFKVRGLPTVKEILREYDFDQATGNLVFKAERETKRRTRGRPPTIAGHTDAYGYRKIWISRHHYPAHRLTWKVIHGVDPVGFIDHINGIRDDNRIENLRDVTPRVNCLNSLRGRWAQEIAHRKLRAEAGKEDRERALLARLKAKYAPVHASMLGRRAARARWRKVKATRQYVGVTACPR